MVEIVLGQDFLDQIEQIFNQAELSQDELTLIDLYNIIDIFCKPY